MSKPQPWSKHAQEQHDDHVRFGDSPTLQCGCVLGEGIQDYGDYFIVFCPTHEAAPALLEASKASVKAIRAFVQGLDALMIEPPSFSRGARIAELLEPLEAVAVDTAAAIAQAEGGPNE